MKASIPTVTRGYPPFNMSLALRAKAECEKHEGQTADEFRRLIHWYLIAQERLVYGTDIDDEMVWARRYGDEAMRVLLNRPITPGNALRHAESTAGEQRPGRK